MKRIKRIYIIIAIAALSSGISGQAQEYLSMDSSLMLAATNNPQLKAAYTRYLAALERVPQVGSLPDPEASFGFFIKPMELLGGNQVSDIRVMQMFPWFGTLNTAMDEASEMAEAKYKLFNAEKADLFFQVKSNWYEMVKISHEILLTNENIELLESLEKIALIKFQEAASSGGGMNKDGQMSSGSSTMNSMGGSGTGMEDVLRVKMEILDQQNMLALLNDQLQTTKSEFNVLLNRDFHTPFGIESNLDPVELPAAKSAIADSILQNNPMLTMLESESNAYEAMGVKARKMGFPMLGAGLDYMLIQKRDGNTSMMNGKDMVMPMISVSIPIYRKKYIAMQKEAQLLQESVQLESESLKNNLQVQYRNFVQSIDDAGRRMSLNKEQEELARKTTDLLLTGFSNTGTGYEEVLRMQSRVLDYGVKYIEAVTDYNTAVALAEKLMNAVKQ